MPVTYSSSIGSTLSIASDSSDNEQPDLVDQTHGVEAAMGEMSGSGSGTAASAAIDAAAFGEDTVAAISADLSVVDGGSATVTSMNADAYAAAQSEDGLVIATTYIGFNYTGSGSYISVGDNSTYSSSGQDGSVSTSSSSVGIVIIDLDEISGAGETSPLLQEPGSSGTPTGVVDLDDPDCGCSDGGDLDLDGNLSSFDVVVFAGGTDSYADLVVDAFALEDQMSTVTVLIDAAIG